MMAATVIVIGPSSQIGSDFCASATNEAITVIKLDQVEFETLDPQALRKVLQNHKAQYVVNASSYGGADRAELHFEDRHFGVHSSMVSLAKLCTDLNLTLIHLSTDYVFSGDYTAPYKEDAKPAPVNIFGKAKLAHEQAIKTYCPKHIILRVGWIFSDNGNNFVLRTLRQLQQQEQVKAVSDQYGCPTYAHDVASVIIAIIKQLECDVEAFGTYHYSGAEVTTWKGFAEAILAAAKKHGASKAQLIEAVTSADWPAKAPRPNYTVLDCHKILATFGIRQRPWRSGLVTVIERAFTPGTRKF